MELTSIEMLTKELESLKPPIAETQVLMKRAGEDREQDNKELKTARGDPWRITGLRLIVMATDKWPRQGLRPERYGLRPKQPARLKA